ncbi:MAG: caspase, EACC1-associated type [Caldilineaceae bacterium]
MSRRLALLISNNQYSDANLTKLAAPLADAEALASVLHDPAIGAFDDVQTLINQPSADVRHEIASFFHGKQPTDLLLLYFSGHGLLDERSRLYLATPDTDAKLPRSRSVEAAYIAQEMDESRSKRQVLILDCCHSGAFRQGITKSSVGQPVQTEAIFDSDGDGRVVLAASDATQYAFEGEKLVGDGVRSLFTHYLIDGLTDLRADANHDGLVTVDELYYYLYHRVTAHTPTQTPIKWNYKQRGVFVLAGQGNPMPTDTTPVPPPAPKATGYRTWVVDQMHRGDFATIGEAIVAAKAGDKILIRPGVHAYEESLIIDKPLEIEGEGEDCDVIIRV